MRKRWQLSEEPEAERARHMLRDYAAAKVTFVAPTIWHYEVANIVHKAVGTRRLSEEEGHLALQALQALDIEFVTFLLQRQPTGWHACTDAVSMIACIWQ